MRPLVAFKLSYLVVVTGTRLGKKVEGREVYLKIFSLVVYIC